MTDSHCHLDACPDPETAADPTLSAIVSIGTTLASSEETLKLAERFANVWAAVGIHPTEAQEALDEGVREKLSRLARHPRVVAIGETGFDYYWDDAPPAAQRQSFEWQAELARALDKPLVLHVRDKQNSEGAALEAVNMLRQAAWPKGILHCFGGHKELLEVGLELGWLVSFAGNLTYKSARNLQEVARELPRERLLVETDSPYLTPVPKRGERNVPANVRYTARFLSELRGEDPAEVEAYTDANARRVYRLPPSA